MSEVITARTCTKLSLLSIIIMISDFDCVISYDFDSTVILI